MVLPAIAARVSSTNPASFKVSECSATGTPLRPATVRQASMAAGVEPQSSCSLKPLAPPRSCSSIDSCETVLPLPSSATLTGHGSIASSIRARYQSPGVMVVAFDPSAGPVPPPMSVVTPEPSAVGTICGQMKCTWQSMPPAVRTLPLPERTSVLGPMTRSGWTPSIVSGLPPLPHRLADHLAAPEDGLLAGQARATAAVLGDFDQQIGVGQPDAVAGGGA